MGWSEAVGAEMIVFAAVSHPWPLGDAGLEPAKLRD